MDFPGGSNGKESARNAGDLGSTPGLGRFPGEGKSYPLQKRVVGGRFSVPLWQASGEEVTTVAIQRLSCVPLFGLFAAPWAAARQASPYFIISQFVLCVDDANHLILRRSLPLLPQSFPAAGSGNHWSALMSGFDYPRPGPCQGPRPEENISLLCAKP